MPKLNWSGLLAVALLPLVGCDEPLELTITHFASINSNMCLVSDTSPSIDRGLLDVGWVSTTPGLTGYVVAPVMKNNIQPVTNSTIATEKRTIQVTGVEVELRMPPGFEDALTADEKNFFAPSAGARIPPGGASTSPIFSEILPATAAMKLTNLVANGRAPSPPTVTARVRPVGRIEDDVIRGEYADFPIELCKNCLLVNLGACPLPAERVAAGGCVPGSDVGATCCTQNGQLLCGAQAPSN
jgi:hypothetical protein